MKIENSTIKNCGFIFPESKKLNIYINNTTLFKSTITGNADTLFVDSCDIRGHLLSAVTGIIKNSILYIAMYGGKYIYFSNNKFIDDISRPKASVLIGDEISHYFIFGDKDINYINSTGNGILHIQDAILDNFTTVSSREYVALNTLNLLNIALHNADFAATNIMYGQWENVKIYPPAKISELNAENIHVYNVSFPEGNPWRGTPTRFAFNVQSKPFDWPEIKIPTLEDLGVNWDWPEPTGAPAGQ
jgi:hypothetical protein